MLEAALQALGSFLDAGMLSMLVAGVISGLVIGMIPGLGGTGAAALLLPFAMNMKDPGQALALMIGALAVVHTSDTISSVLIGAPGSASAAVTMLDGHALARQGQAARALSVSFLSSMAGGVLGAIGLTLSIPVARPIVLAFGAPELFMLCVLGISFAATLSQGKMIKGLISALLGVFLGMVGSAPNAAEYRFTGGFEHLMDGLPLVAVALGVFGLAEIAEMLGGGGAIASRISMGSGWLQGVRDFLEHKWHVVRGSLVGIWAGVLPGVGATAGTLMAYGQAMATAKDRSRFGKGDVRGLIAPEAANNACEAGDLIPTLLFSIPGGTPSAILMGVLLFYGIQPGPRIITDHLNMVYVIIWSFALASVLGAAICFFVSPVMARLSFVPFTLLTPALVVLMVLGVYNENLQMGELVFMVVLGLLGWVLKRAGFPRGPLLIGFVLALPVERYYWLTAKLYTPSQWMVRPWVLGMAALLVVSTAWSVWRSRQKSSSGPEELQELAEQAEEQEEDNEEATDPRWSFGVSVALVAVFACALVAAFGYSSEARLMPVLAGVPAVVLALGQAVADSRLMRTTVGLHAVRRGQLNGLVAFAWLIGLLAVTYFVGFNLGVALYTMLFLRVMNRSRWLSAAAYTVGVLGAMTLLNWALGVVWPEGLMPIF